MSLSSLDSLDTYIKKRKSRKSKRDIWNEFNADDDISHGEYDSDCSVGVIIDSDDDYSSIFSNDYKADLGNLCVIGKQMPVQKVDSNIDLDSFLPDKMFFEPKVIAAPKENANVVNARDSKARGSSSETERLIREEIETMEKENEAHKNTDKGKHSNEKKPQQREATPILKDKSDVVRTVKDLHCVNKENKKDNSPKKPLFYSTMIQSSFNPPRAGTPQMCQKDQITKTKRKQDITSITKVSNNKKKNKKLKQSGTGSFSGNSLRDSSSGRVSMASSFILLPTVASSGIVSSKSSLTAARREQKRKAKDIRDIGRQDTQQTQQAKPRKPLQRTHRIAGSVRSRVRAAHEEPKKPNLLQRIQTRLATPILKDKSDVVRTVKDLHCVNKENKKDNSPKKPLFYSTMIQSSFNPPRAGTPQMCQKDQITKTKRKQDITSITKVSNNKKKNKKLKQSGTGSFSGNSLRDSSSGRVSMASSFILLPTVASSGIVSSKSSLTAARREQKRKAKDIRDIGRQDTQQTQQAKPRKPLQRTHRIAGSVRSRVRAAHEEPKKPNLLQRIQTRLVRFEHFIRKRLMSLSCTRGSPTE